MNKPEWHAERTERDPGPVPELSAEERAVLARIEKQARPKRRKPLWKRFADDSPLYFWWCFPGF